MNSREILKYLKSKQDYYNKKFGIKFIGIFGSFARGDINSDSDIDILYRIDRDKKLSIFKYLQLMQELENFFHRKIDLIRYEALKPKIKEYIEKDIKYV